MNGQLFASTEDEIASVQAGPGPQHAGAVGGRDVDDAADGRRKLMPILPLIARPGREATR